MAAMDALFAEKREERRAETARRLIHIRVAASVAWFVFTVVFGVFGDHPDYRANIPVNGAYVSASLLLYLGSLRFPTLLRRSWMSLPLVDFPVIFIIQYRSIPLASTPVGTAAFSIGLLAILIVVAQLSMRVRNVLITAAMAIVIEVLLMMHAGIPLYGWAAAAIVLCTIAFAASAVVNEVSILLGAIVSERMRIARELHDTLAQGLAGVSLQLENVGVTLESSPAVARQHLERASALARSSLAEARRSVWSLRTPAAAADLVESLGEVVRRLAADSGARIRLHVTGERRRLPPDTEEDLLRIAQEALLNAARHADATEIEVELRFDRRRVLMAVRDDGVGMSSDVAEMAANGHFGILGMQERAGRLDGALQIRDRESGGTEIVLAVEYGSARRGYRV